MIEFSPHYTEGPHEFTLRHSYLSMSFSDNLHVAAPIKIAAMICRRKKPSGKGEKDNE